MPRYIDADALLEEFDTEAPTNWNDTESEIQEQTDFRYYRGLVENAPTADVAEVKHGEWIRKDGFLVCSECDATKPIAFSTVLKTTYYKCDFCNRCGAKMDGERKEKNEF